MLEGIICATWALLALLFVVTSIARPLGKRLARARAGRYSVTKVRSAGVEVQASRKMLTHVYQSFNRY